MKLATMITALAAAAALAGTAQAGCLGGAAVGGVAGHFAGRHRHYRGRGYGHA